MITLSEIKKELKDLIHADIKDLKNSEMTRRKSRIEFLKSCQRYMEFKPSPEFIEKDLARIENRINLIMADFVDPKNADKKTLSKIKKKYETENGIPHLRVQARTLRYLAK